MTTSYDLGGKLGFGSFTIEQNEPVFHKQWEVFPYCAVFIGTFPPQSFNTDEYRHAVERMEDTHYMHASYYERVLTAAATLFVEKEILTVEELEDSAAGRFPLSLPVAADAGQSLIESKSESKSKASRAFAVGEKVRVLDSGATGHTRAPRYVRGKQGKVTRITPPFTLPDANAHGLKHEAEPTYHVYFSSIELWGEEGEENTGVIVDLWQSYLEGV